MRALAVSMILAALAVVATLTANPRRGTALWPGARYTADDRRQAIERGLHFLYRSIACNASDFQDYGHDLLFAFYNIAETSQESDLRSAAFAMGHERALEWRRIHPAVPAGVNADQVATLVSGSYTADRLGAPDLAMKRRLRVAAGRFSPYDYLWFNPQFEPPPADVPEECARCRRQNVRGARTCARCGAKLTMRSRYSILLDALVTTYTGDLYGVTLGAHYRDVLKWLPAMHPYPEVGRVPLSEYYDAVYAATHVIYTYNDYSQHQVSPECFPAEFAYLKANQHQAIADDDPETMGEYLDSLRAFGLTLRDPQIAGGIEYLLSVQHPDGSWGSASDPYTHYHSTWTAIDGLRDYRWQDVLPCPAF